VNILVLQFLNYTLKIVTESIMYSYNLHKSQTQLCLDLMLTFRGHDVQVMHCHICCSVTICILS
jgi:hypothetical protein